mmetsp:Transcript_14357/g.40829  ORF Transcript_14357/g.40829 Transcript_14357/m.40829 type:complete len:206 (+) Transcript_14357:3-620(+)
MESDVLEKLSVVESILKLTNVQAKAFPMNKTSAEDLVKEMSTHLEYLPRSRDLINAKCNVLLSLHKYSSVLGILGNVKKLLPLLPHKRDPNQAGPDRFDSDLLWLEALACSGLGKLDKAIKLGEMCCQVDSCAIHRSVAGRVEKWKRILDLKKICERGIRVPGEQEEPGALYPGHPVGRLQERGGVPAIHGHPVLQQERYVSEGA